MLGKKGQQALNYAGQKGQEAMDNVREVGESCMALSISGRMRSLTDGRLYKTAHWALP
jgi:hypothetical protein